MSDGFREALVGVGGRPVLQTCFGENLGPPEESLLEIVGVGVALGDFPIKAKRGFHSAGLAMGPGHQHQHGRPVVGGILPFQVAGESHSGVLFPAASHQ